MQVMAGRTVGAMHTFDVSRRYGFEAPVGQLVRTSLTQMPEFQPSGLRALMPGHQPYTPCPADLQVRRLGLELMRTARELRQTLGSPPLPSSKRTTMAHGADGGGPAGSRRSTLQSAAGRNSRRSTTAHGVAAVGLRLEGGSLSLPPTAGGAPRPVFVADIIDRLVGRVAENATVARRWQTRSPF